MPRRLLVLLCALCWGMPACAASEDDRDIVVAVQVDGDAVRVDADFTVRATPREVWATMTDFAHLADFISNLRSSQVLSHSGDVYTVAQKGIASAGLLSFEFDSVREVRLKPYEQIDSRMLSGNMKKFEGLTRLTAEGDVTRIVYHSDAVSAVWIPPLIGRAFIVGETREQFAEMRREILRRKLAAAR